MRIKIQRSLQVNSTPNLIPLIDVVLQLVVFFMITTTFAKTPGISLTLPQSSTAEPVQTTQLIITVISREEIYLNQDKYQFDGFLAMMSDYNKEQKEELKNVVIEGDENVSYKLLVEVLDVLRKNGIQGANLKTTVYRLEPPSQS